MSGEAGEITPEGYFVLVACECGQEFERWVTLKSIEPLSELERAVPVDGSVEVKIADPIAFQWATYYLRRHRAAFTAGSLAAFDERCRHPAARLGRGG